MNDEELSAKTPIELIAYRLRVIEKKLDTAERDRKELTNKTLIGPILVGLVIIGAQHFLK